MTDRVRMKSRTVFANEQITVFPPDGPPEGVVGGTVTDGQEFEAGLNLAKDLDRLGHAEPLNRADLEGDAAPLEPHYSVSVPQMRQQDPNWTPTLTPGTTFPSAGPANPATDGRPTVASIDLRDDGPTVEEYVSAGYKASGYPPSGYSSRSTDEEIAAAVAAESSDTTEATEEPAPGETAVISSTRRRNVAARAN